MDIPEQRGELPLCPRGSQRDSGLSPCVDTLLELSKRPMMDGAGLQHPHTKARVIQFFGHLSCLF
jgi:hypothetical protein